MARIKFLTAWRRYGAGEVADVEDMLADVWVAHGIAERVADEGAVEPFDGAQDRPECMAVEAPERAVQRRPRPRRRKKGTT